MSSDAADPKAQVDASDEDCGCGDDLDPKTMAKYLTDVMLARQPWLDEQWLRNEMLIVVEETLALIPESLLCCTDMYGESRRLGREGKCTGPKCGPMGGMYFRVPVNSEGDEYGDQDDAKDPLR
ncbi:MAG: hypothetical protein ACF8PN_15350 [Phycisphaerales bacterium]